MINIKKVLTFFSEALCLKFDKLLEEVQQHKENLLCTWRAALQATEFSQQQHAAQIVNAFNESKQFFDQLIGCEIITAIQEKCRTAVFMRSVGKQSGRFKYNHL